MQIYTTNFTFVLLHNCTNTAWKGEVKKLTISCLIETT